MAFVTEAALIALREGLEALLITGILLGLVTRLGRPDTRKYVWAGFGAAVLTALLAGWAVNRYLLSAFEAQGGAIFELAAALVAIATLLYMVFWMWSHTARVLSDAKRRVRTALTTGSLATIVFVAYVTTVREGLETVLFYSALAANAATTSLMWSGALGFAASALLVYLILKSSRKISVKAFFTATGLWLIVVAAMLSTHVVAAATELGLIATAPAIWDTSHIIAGDSALGRILHATLGYTAAPTLLQAVGYFGILFGAGGAYLYKQGAFTRSTTGGPRPRRARVGTAAVAFLLVAATVAGAALDPTDRMLQGHHEDEDADNPTALELPEDATVGVLLRDHGEPVHYNATTYESFKGFYRALLETLGYEALLEVDQGTILLDQEAPFQEEPRLDPSLVDAWLDAHPGPALWTGSPVDEQELPIFDGFYQAPGGPGLGEPDVLEAMGLSTYQAYLQMENQSPMYHDKTSLLDDVEQRIVERLGPGTVVERAHHIQPMVDPSNESLEQAVDRLQEKDVDVLVDAYTSALHSDVMNTCMKQQALQETLEQKGYHPTLLQAGPYGLEPAFAEGIAEHIVERVDTFPDEAHVWVSLTHHGIDPSAQSPCEDRPEPYVDQTFTMYENTAEALSAHETGPNLTHAMVYGQGAQDSEEVLAPMQALEEAQQAGATHVLDIPYELPGNGFDNLVQHRQSYGLQPENAPHYDSQYETHLTRHGLEITITRSDIAHDARATAQVDAIQNALAEWQPGGT